MASGQTPLTLISAENDPFSKFKSLIPRLKESLCMVMKLAGLILHQNAQVDGCIKTGELNSQRFDKSLEEFYGICDQIELNLKLVIDCQSTAADSNKHTPVPVQMILPQPDSSQPPEHQQSYSQYLATIKTQINSAQELHDNLTKCVKNISDKHMTLPQQLQNTQQTLMQQQQQHQQGTAMQI